MKKLGKGKGQRVHPVPPPRDHLAALPAAVLALAAALTAEEQEVLAYLLSGTGAERWREWPRRRRVHPPELGCRCFGCYTSFWSRWDASPNRHVIHRIIDAVEESLEASERGGGSGGRRRRRSGRGGRKGTDLKAVAASAAGAAAEGGFGAGVKELLVLDGDDDDASSSIDDDYEETEEMSNLSKSSVGRFMSFIGERVWGVWN